MPTRTIPESQGRETRILLLIVIVSIALLLVLARLRYPAAELPVIAPTQTPLVSMAPASVSFDDLSRRLTSLVAHVSPRVMPVEIEPAVRRRGGEPEVRLSLAVRLRPDLAVAHIPAGWRPRALAGGSELAVAGADDGRELAVLRVAPDLEGQIVPATEAFGGMTYVGVISATRGGPTVQPVFVGRVAPFSDSEWPVLLDLGPLPTVPPGSAVFSMDGQLLGLVITRAQANALIPTTALLDALTALVPGGAPAQ